MYCGRFAMVAGVQAPEDTMPKTTPTKLPAPPASDYAHPITPTHSVNGTKKNDYLVGRNGSTDADKISGFEGNDELHGGAGADLLLGGPGNDKLFGDHGRDTLTGGSGSDQF